MLMPCAALEMFRLFTEGAGWLLVPGQLFGLSSPKRFGIVEGLGKDFVLKVRHRHAMLWEDATMLKRMPTPHPYISPQYPLNLNLASVVPMTNTHHVVRCVLSVSTQYI